MPNEKKIIEQYFHQQQPDETRRKFFFWLKNPASAKEKEEALSGLWEELSIPAGLSTKESYKQMEKRLGFRKQAFTRIIYVRAARIAAVLLILILSLATGRLYIQNRELAETNLVECFVPNGEIRRIELPDKSRVVINSGSTLFYKEGLRGKTRDIYLSGEAKFTVRKDKNKPFIVKTNDMTVEALGTVFNISSYPDNSITAATLIEGKIRANIRSTNEEFILTPSEQLAFNRGSGQSESRKTRLDYVLAWEKGQLVFQSASLQAIVKELERRYDVAIYLNSINLKDEKLNVKFLYNESLEEILHTLQQIISGFKYKIEGNKIYIN